MLQDYKLGLRMLLKYPGLTLAGGLALAIAIGIGAGWYDLVGKIVAPTIPLPEGDRLVLIETQNILTNEPEPRVVRDFLEWRRELRTIEDLGAYRTDTRNLVVGNAAPEPIQMAELTAVAFGTARVPPLLGRALLDSDEMPGAPSVVVLSYDVWQRSLGSRQDVLGSVVKLGNTPATVIGVMPKGFGYPVNHDAWTPLSLRASYGALESGAISVIGRLACWRYTDNQPRRAPMTFNARAGFVFAAFAVVLLLAVATRQGDIDVRFACAGIGALVAIEALTIFGPPFWRRSS